MKLHRPSQIFYLFLLALSAGLAVIGDRAEQSVQSSHREDDHPHVEGSNSTPEQQARMAAFHYNKGNKSLKEEHFKDAIHQYEMALAHTPDMGEVYVNMSTALIRLGDWEKARQTLDALQKKAPRLPQLHYNLACYHALTDNPQEALAAIQEAVTLGYRPLQDIQQDPDLERLRNFEGFREWWQSIQKNGSA